MHPSVALPKILLLWVANPERSRKLKAPIDGKSFSFHFYLITRMMASQKYRSNKNPSHHSRQRFLGTAAAMTTIRRATFSIAHGTYWKLNAFLLFAFFLIFVIIYFVSWFFFVGFPPSLDGGVAARYFDRFHYSLFVAINRTNELSEGLLRRNLLGNSYPWPRGGFTLAFLESTLRGGSSKSDSVLSLEVNTTDMFQSIISTNEITMPINI